MNVSIIIKNNIQCCSKKYDINPLKPNITFLERENTMKENKMRPKKYLQQKNECQK